MGDFIDPEVLDKGPDFFQAQVATLKAVKGLGQPADLAAATANELSSIAFVSADTSLANGDVSGRKLILNAKADLDVGTGGGDTDWFCYCSATKILAGFDMALAGRTKLTGLAAASKFNVGAAQIEYRDP